MNARCNHIQRFDRQARRAVKVRAIKGVVEDQKSEGTRCNAGQSPSGQF
jgi:hypothetical protein